MAVLEMQKIELCAWKSRRRKVLEYLQREGTVQMDESGEEGFFSRQNLDSLCTAFEKRSEEAEEALRILELYVPEKKGIFASLEGKKPLTEEEYIRRAKEREAAGRAAEEIRKADREMEESREAGRRISAERESLVPWLGLDLPPDTSGTAHAAFLAGTLPGTWTREKILAELKGKLPETAAFELEVLGAETGQTILDIFCLRSQRAEVEEGLRKLGFARCAFQFSETPAEYDRELAQKAEAEAARQEAVRRKLQELSAQRQKLQFLADYCTMQAEKYRVQSRLLQSRHVFFLSGFVPRERADALREKLEQSFSCAVVLTEPEKGEKVPVQLRNNRFSEPVESVVESYGLPDAGEADPTSVMAFFYYFFFGLMLSDAGYGAVMTAGCLIARKKFPGMGEGLKKMVTMFLYCGISTTIWGILFGGYFGDAIPVVAETFFHRQVTVPAVWFAPLDDPMKLLIFSFLFGIIHLFTGLGVKAYLLLRDRKYLDCFCEVGFWYMLLAGLILMLLPSGIFASMSGTAFVFPGWLNALARILAAAGALGIVLMTGRRRKNFGLRLALGAYELYGVTSWLSDVLSYSRLLALGIATGVIASVINTMAAMAGGGAAGAVVFAVIFLAGHTLNMAINLLGAYVHTNRLQYVEFFGKFYEGSGEPFRPFSAESNKYFQIKE